MLGHHLSGTSAILQQYFGSAKAPLKRYFSSTLAVPWQWLGCYSAVRKQYCPCLDSGPIRFRDFAISRFRDSVSGSWTRDHHLQGKGNAIQARLYTVPLCPMLGCDMVARSLSVLAPTRGLVLLGWLHSINRVCFGSEMLPCG